MALRGHKLWKRTRTGHRVYIVCGDRVVVFVLCGDLGQGANTTIVTSDHDGGVLAFIHAREKRRRCNTKQWGDRRGARRCALAACLPTGLAPVANNTELWWLRADRMSAVR